ncbi:MAG TPA: hypothetical protein VGP18_06780 [Solirubrobacteraceae bacterium]|nr:hypothetical protein [Solirubrobacteraceae bacterium]
MATGTDGAIVSEKSTNVPFMLRVYCDTCGHSMLFDSERCFRGECPDP